jgi:hypothetical protein
LTDLNLADNNLGEVVLTAGWRSRDGDGAPWIGPDGQKVWEMPGEADGIAAIAAVIPGMGALTSLDLSSNKLNAEGGKIVAEAIKVTNNCQCDGGLTAVVYCYPQDNGALTKLDISSNDIGAEQEGGLQRICMAGGIELAK